MSKNTKKFISPYISLFLIIAVIYLVSISVYFITTLSVPLIYIPREGLTTMSPQRSYHSDNEE